MAKQEKTCTWTLQNDFDSEYWETDCGEAFCVDGTLEENHMHYCHNCGGRIVPVEPPPEDDEEE